MHLCDLYVPMWIRPTSAKSSYTYEYEPKGRKGVSRPRFWDVRMSGPHLKVHMTFFLGKNTPGIATTTAEHYDADDDGEAPQSNSQADYLIPAEHLAAALGLNGKLCSQYHVCDARSSQVDTKVAGIGRRPGATP